MNEYNVNSRGSQVSPRLKEPRVDLKQLWSILVSHWLCIVASVIAFVMLAFLYLWFTPSTATVTGKMEIINKSKKNSTMSAGLAMLNSLPMGLGSSLGGSAGAGSVDAEREIILSKSLVTNVVKDLKLYTEYRLSRWGRKTLLYQNNPLEVTLDDAHVAWLDSELPLYHHKIKLTITKNNDGYKVEPTLVEGKDETDLPAQSIVQLPAVIKTESGTLTIKENALPEKQAKAFAGGYTLKITIIPPTETAKNFIVRTTFEAASKKAANMVNISLTDENIIRAIDYVNRLVEAYNKRANDEKNEEALKTDEFVNARLAKIDAELGSSDAAWENSKKSFQISEPEMDAKEALTKKSEYEAKLVAIGTELQPHDYLSEYINDPSNLYEIIPTGLAGSSAPSGKSASGGSSASGNTSLIAQHNSLVNQRKDLLKSVSEVSPQIQRLNESIKELHPTLKLAMKRDRQQLVMQKNIAEREFAHYSGRIGSAPQMERVLTEIGRQREIKQGVYLLMLQKREETAMELANVTDKGKFIDLPTVDPASGKPQKKMVYFVAVFLGAFLSMGAFYMLQMIKTRIDTRDELASATKLPILADIDNNTDDAIRTLRTNLLLNLKEGQKTILVASNNTGDGKSFIAQRLTDSLTTIGKKAVLVNGDMRSLNLTNGQHAADIIAGAEFVAQVADAKSSNDYVIIDSPALGEYNDAYQLASYADATLYVAKAGKAQKSDIVSLATNKNLPNPLIVFNK